MRHREYVGRSVRLHQIADPGFAVREGVLQNRPHRAQRLIDFMCYTRGQLAQAGDAVGMGELIINRREFSSARFVL